MRFWKCVVPFLASTLCFAVQPDRIAGEIDSAHKVALKGNVHGLAQPRFELGRTDGSMMLHGITLAFRPSAAQHKHLANFLAHHQPPSSPNPPTYPTPSP